ncbi:Hypothetical protein CINCED_3A020102 [Cinara cedri]|uniref:Uncharacterized protein n=1 Tax=Cinara cedri TaxID=506608 RepID=A0A5E4N7Q6_9HEMI|nr:Hypothetical protein CINCED_3A020102 [Cinara cedri]
MFSIFKFLNFKSDADKTKVSNSLSGKTLNLKSPEGKALNMFSNKSPIAPKQNVNDTSLSNNKETVSSPGFSYRITQRAHEMRSTIPNTDLSNMQTSFSSDLNGTNSVNNTHTIPKDIYDKKRKLMESLDNFGVRKRTRQESGVDTFVYRRQRTINEFNSPDRVTVINGHSHRSTQPISTIIGSKSVNLENRKTKRHGDFGITTCHLQKKPRTRNNEILSSYSSSKFLKTGQKRPHPIDHEGDSPNRKHCKSCTCCGSTMILEDQNYQNNSNKNDKTTETDLSEDLVTFAASRIFNRSGKTQRVKKICMKTILDDVFEDEDPIPFTSIDKVAEKKKKAEENVLLLNQHTDKSNLKNTNQVFGAVSSTIATTVINEIQPSVTSILSTASTLSVSSTTLTTPLPVQSTITKTNEINTNFQVNVNSSITSSEVNGKTTDSQAPDSTKNVFLVPKNTEKSPNKQKLLFQSLEKNKNIINDKSLTSGENDLNSDKQSFQCTKPNKHTNNLSVVQSDGQNVTNRSKKELAPSLVFGNQVENTQKQSTVTIEVPKANEKQVTPRMQFGASKTDEKQSTPPVMQFGASKTDEKQSTPPVLQFGSPKTDEKKSTPPVMQFGASKTDEKQSTPPVMQFGSPKTVEKQSIPPVLQFGSPKTDEKKSTPPVMQFGASKTDEKKSIPPVVQFGIAKESENSISTSSLFSFGDNQISSGISKPIEPVKFNFGSLKPLDSTASSIEPKNVFGTSNLQNQSLFKFGKTDDTPDNPPKYDANAEKPTSKLQFSTLSTSVFGTSNTNQPKPQFSTSVSQSIDNQGPKIVFGNLITENKPTTSASGMIFGNSTNPVFQFNNSSSKPNEKPSEVSNNAFSFSSNKTVPNFGGSAPQGFGEKQSFQFNGEKKEESKNQFSTSVFGSSNTVTPFKFGDNNKPTSFGTTFNSNQPLQFTNNTEKTKEPFKFGAVIPTSNAFQFSANKTDNGPVKFGQASSTFPASGFSGFGNPAPQQTTAFGSVPSSQPSLFVNTNTPTVAPTFGSVASSTNTFAPNQGFQFTNNATNSSSTFAFSGNTQPTKPDGGFSFNAASTTPSQPFQFGSAPLPLSTSQFGGNPPQGSFNFGSNPMSGTGKFEG